MNVTWGKDLKMGANNFETTYAVQAMILKVLMATDFFHGLPFETKRPVQQELRLMRFSKTQLCSKIPGNQSLTVTLGTSDHHMLTDWKLGAWGTPPPKHWSDVLYASTTINSRVDPSAERISQNWDQVSWGLWSLTPERSRSKAALWNIAPTSFNINQ